MPLTPRAWRAWYADGTIISSADSPWQLLPGADVRGVAVVYAETYQVHRAGWEEQGTQVGPRRDTERYREWLVNAEAYWRTADGHIWAGALANVPVAVPLNHVKTGAPRSTLPAQRRLWWQWYNMILAQREP